jgi:cell division protein FtsZ
MPGLINLDFADIKTVMAEMGKAMMGTGEGEGEDRALKAAEAAISNPLLDDVSMKGARGVLINITGGPDMMLFEVDQAANRIRAEVDPDANIIFGGTILENMEGRLRVSVVATGIESEAMAKMPPNVEPLRPRASRPMSMRPDAMQMSSNPVLRQVAALSEDINAPMATAEPVQLSPVEPMILSETAMEEEEIPMPEPVQPIPLRAEIRREPETEPKRRRGLFGSWKSEKKVEARVEPAAQRAAQPTRATAQVLARNAAEPQRAPNLAEDLFPDHKKDDQFEIPAFLRRQTN